MAGITALVAALFSVTDKLLDKMPDYDQRKKEKYFKLRTRYNDEFKKDYPSRDDDLILNLRDELLSFIDTFSKEVS